MPGPTPLRLLALALAAGSVAADAAGIAGGSGFALALLPALLLFAALVAGWFPGEQAVAALRDRARRRVARRAPRQALAPAQPRSIRPRVLLLACVATRRGPPVAVR